MLDIDNLDIKKILEHAHMGVVIHRADTSIVYANPAALKLLRLSYEQLIGRDAYDPQWAFVDENGFPLELSNYPVNRVLNSNKRLENETIGLIDSTSKEISWYMVNAYMEGRLGAENCFVVVTFSDITERVKPFSAEDILENAQDMIIVTEADNVEYPEGPKIVYVNKAFETLTGYSKEEVIGESPRILQGSLTDKVAKNEIYEALKKKQSISQTLLNYDKSGRPYWIDMNIIPLKNKAGQVTHFAAIERDVSQIKFQQEQLANRNNDLKALKASLEKRVSERTLSLQQAKNQLENMAYFDPLTQLPNRRFFSVHLSKQLAAAKRRNEMIAMGLIDIDNFKQINDNYGHSKGDEVLKGFAEIINDVFRHEDAICRYGGEEFTFSIIIHHIEQAEQACERLMQAIRATRYNVGDTTVNVTASIGVCVTHCQADTDEHILYRSADNLMYKAKQQGKDRYYIGDVE